MKTITINSLVVTAATVGLMVTANISASAQGIPQPPSIRDCARQMCMMLRNCGGEVPEKVKKPEGTRSNKVEKADQSNNTQGFSESSCRDWSYQAYLQCAQGGFNGVKPQNTVTPADTKK